MVREFLCAFLAMVPVSFGQTRTCRTALDVPCYTVRGTTTGWQILRRGRGDIGQFKTTYLDALSRDGSSISTSELSEATVWFLFSTAVTPGKVASLYLAPMNQIVTVNYSQETIARREPLMWSDLPYRRSAKGDATCKTGILHYGTDFRLDGTAMVAGISVVKWSRSLGHGGSEEAYLAPSIDCILLKWYTIRRNAFWVPIVIDTREASSVELGEPNPDLFKLPFHFREIEDPRRAQIIQFLDENARHGMVIPIR